MNKLLKEVAIMKIYIYKNKINNKVYIGQTNLSLEERAGKNGEIYTKKLRNGKYKHPKFGAAIKKYGWINFKPEILFDGISQEEANKKETELISQYNSINEGYNVSKGGNSWGYIVFDEETKKRISEKNIAYQKIHGNAMKGRKHLLESKRKMSESGKKKIFTKEHREKISKSISGLNHPFYGKHHSLETKQKISINRKGLNIGAQNHNYNKIFSEKTRKLMSENRTGVGYRVRNKQTGEIFETIKEAAKSCGLKDGTNITAQIKGRGKTAGGFTWEYV